jgi:hypothetical protein
MRHPEILINYGIGRMGFINDLTFGNQWERNLLNYVEHDSVQYSPKGCKGWDVELMHEGCAVRYEVKADRLAHRTGNLAIEFACHRKPSGITTSEADYYAYFIIRDGEEPVLYLIPTADLRLLMEDPKEDWRTVRGGDGWRAEMLLIPLVELEQYIF